MNDGLSDDIKKKFMLPLTIELHLILKKKRFITPQSPLVEEKSQFDKLLLQVASCEPA